MRRILIGLFIGLLLSGCTNILCKPNYMVAIAPIPKASWDMMMGGVSIEEKCKAICYKAYETQSFMVNKTFSQGSISYGCWCDVNNCGLNETEYI